MIYGRIPNKVIEYWTVNFWYYASVAVNLSMSLGSFFILFYQAMKFKLLVLRENVFNNDN